MARKTLVLIYVLSAMGTTACRTPGLTLDPDQKSDDPAHFRSASASLTSVSCADEAAGALSVYELAWDPAQDRLVLDLYGEYGDACPDAKVSALVDHIADTLFVTVERKTCNNACGSGYTHLAITVDDDLRGLQSLPSLVVTAGLDLPDHQNVVFKGATFPTYVASHQFIPRVVDTSLSEDSPPMLTVNFQSASCDAANPWRAMQRNTDTLIAPYASERSDCISANTQGHYFFQQKWPAVPGAKLKVLSKVSSDHFAFVEVLP